jgi:hypothetical protein
MMRAAAYRRWLLLAVIVLTAATWSGAPQAAGSAFDSLSTIRERTMPAAPVVAVPAHIETARGRRAPAGGPDPGLGLAVVVLLAWLRPGGRPLGTSSPATAVWSSLTRRRHVIGLRAPPAPLFT